MQNYRQFLFARHLVDYYWVYNGLMLCLYSCLHWMVVGRCPVLCSSWRLLLDHSLVVCRVSISLSSWSSTGFNGCLLDWWYMYMYIFVYRVFIPVFTITYLVFSAHRCLDHIRIFFWSWYFTVHTCIYTYMYMYIENVFLWFEIHASDNRCLELF